MKTGSLLLSLVLALTVLARPAAAGQAPLRSADPYLGAIVIDAATGDVLFENHADAKGYPASMLKLMDLLVIEKKLAEGALTLQDLVTVSGEVSKIGGSQVYLKEKEVFPVEELIYAMMVQSANDAATALAIQIAGTKDGFTDLMNEEAKALGMTSTEFHSVHGLPPAADQEPDVSTPRDFAKLCRELVTKYPDILKYTSTQERPFRPDAKEPFIMRTHNPLLSSYEGCDGLKTGYFTKAGFSIATTASRKGDRVIAVIMGSLDKKVRNAKAAELMSKGFNELAKRKAGQAKPAPAPAPAPAQ